MTGTAPKDRRRVDSPEHIQKSVEGGCVSVAYKMSVQSKFNISVVYEQDRKESTLKFNIAQMAHT